MATGSICNDWLATAADGQDFELRSKRLGQRSNGTPKLLRSDVTSSPYLATPSLPQRKCRTSLRTRVGSYRLADGTSISVTTVPTDGQYADDESRSGSGRPGSFSEGLLVIALEEENERLKGVLETERCARQTAEAEAIRQAARARECEHQMNKLSLQLAEAERKLGDLEQAAFNRTLVQAWLETATPQRCASVDQRPQSSRACSVVPEERKPQIESAVDLIKAIGSANCPPALSGEDYGFDQERSANNVTVDMATVVKQQDVRPHGTFGLLDAGSGAEFDLSDWDGAVIVRRSDWAISPHVRVRSGPSTPVSRGCPAMPLQAPAPLPAPGRVGCQALPCAESPPRSCTFLPASKLLGAPTPGGADCRSAGLLPACSLSLQDEKRWPPLPLPHMLVADSPGIPVAQMSGRGNQPPGVDFSLPAVNAVSAHTLTAARIWMPSGAALCHSGGFEPPNCAIQPSPSLLSAIPGGGEPVAKTPNGPLLEAFSAPNERIHPQLQHQHHQHPEYYQHCQVPSHPHQLWPPGSLRITERSPRLGGSSAVSLYSPSGLGPYYGGTRAAVSSFCSAPLDAHLYPHQDGGEWCNIPLGSPVGTPKNGTVFDGNI
ncbi:hypothetical protein VaNZ11_004632 [Volvox africanus]|uniref:Uncharacterized protein n=1 Tax=Volvox africanus TaxID=51714 RepID=A0ABQ5RY22_9CHLO|nr:hypothetical protein VaNZ11_004632 [Volvox africanus]